MLHFFAHVLDWHDPLVLGWVLMVVLMVVLFVYVMYLIWSDWYYYFVMEDEKYEKYVGELGAGRNTRS